MVFLSVLTKKPIGTTTAMYANGIPIEKEVMPEFGFLITLVTIAGYCEGSNVAFRMCDKHFDQCHIQDHTLHQHPHEHNQPHVVEQHSNGWTDSLYVHITDNWNGYESNITHSKLQIPHSQFSPLPLRTTVGQQTSWHTTWCECSYACSTVICAWVIRKNHNTCRHNLQKNIIRCISPL